MAELTAQHSEALVPSKQKKTLEELAAMIHHDLSQIEGYPQRGIKVTVYGLNTWSAMLTFGVDSGPVPNKADPQALFKQLPSG
ncbi:MAG: hypothetical protein P4M05_31225 [Bradyrhizobium sp.]|nr:hypothetical protein [Bradyrhizobium sp.]